MNADIQIFFFTVGGGLFFSGLIFLLIEQRAANSLRGGKYWALGNFSLFLGFFLIGVGDIIPDFFAVALANTILANATAFYFLAICHVARRPYNLKLLYTFMILTFAVETYFTFVQPDYSARMLAILIVSVFFSSLILRQLSSIKVRELSGSVSITKYLFFGLAFLAIWRGIYEILTYDPNRLLLNEGILLEITVTSVFVGTTLLTISFVLLSNASNYLEVQRMAYEDSLTKTFSRRAIMDRLKSEMSMTNRTGIPFTTILIDFDNLKEINDQFGHQAGDEVLIKIASAIKENLRNHDSIGRMGGDEFIVILSNANLKGAEFVIERLLKEIRGLEYSFEQQVFVSIGGVQCNMGKDTLDSLIAQADQNLYQIKHQGGDNFLLSD